MIYKRTVEVDFMDHETFVDLSFSHMLDKYSMLVLNLMMIFYPFRIFSFISRFNFSSQIGGVLSTIARISPGMCTFVTIAIVCIGSLSVSGMLIFGPYIPCMDHFLGAFSVISSQSLFDLQEFRDNSQMSHFSLFAVFVNAARKFGTVIFVALAVYLFSKAIVFEKALAVENEDEDQTEFIEEIHEKVSQILGLNKQAFGVTGSETAATFKQRNSQSDKNFKNRKVVAWLLNRSREDQKTERQLFFKKLNMAI